MAIMGEKCLRMRNPQGTKFSTPVTSRRSDGSVNRDWVAGDLDQAGTYKAEVEITSSGGKKQT